MQNNAQLAAFMLREAADFFSTLAAPNREMAATMQRMAGVYRTMATVLETDPLGPVPEALA